MLTDTFERQMFFTTLRITIPSSDAATNSIGTGFLFSLPLRQAGSLATFLVSNRHVFGDPKGTIILNFHKADPASDGPLQGEIVPVAINDFSGYYYAHPNPEVDLACINVSTYTRRAVNVFHMALAQQFVNETALKKVHAGQAVSFVGYPENRFDSKHNLPILRKGTIASLPNVDFNGLPQIVIDAQVFPGSSGSPVFVEVDGLYYLLGVIAQTMIRHAKLQTLQTAVGYGVEQTIGLGIVLKVSVVTDLIAYAAAALSAKIDAESAAAEQSVPRDVPASRARP